ncbi:MAG: 4-(cytidine 5'-diphospho)-2-C-methyl-D-erythritol kinase [Akkermansiaceae bacterium]|nr:4-(cytidine 5'-diphospho)-2-C-methyl-D-erythritol kinase [Akkermansiaceae bacterium]MCP5542601.1 4-(cytidine 5'-diphospho)-2-C-methyl-D-erythritol kinase [Akkermansiaceae bacterium]
MSRLETSAPAKINLSLRVLGKRDDGFHELDTWMVTLPGLADRLTLEDADCFSFTCDDPALPTGEGNLVVKALRAFESAAGISWNGRIHLEKRIPHGAGLGGGSSDAAALLMALNDLAESPLPHDRLVETAASIGSDIPFFLGGGSTRCRGRGEVLEDAPAAPGWRLLLLKPSFAVATPDAYGRWASASPLPGISHGPQTHDGVELVNDLEVPVFGKHRFLAELKQWLLDRSEVSAALMCGSGSTVFAVLRDGTDGEHLARCARQELDPGLWHWCGAIRP